MQPRIRKDQEGQFEGFQQFNDIVQPVPTVKHHQESQPCSGRKTKKLKNHLSENVSGCKPILLPHKHIQSPPKKKIEKDLELSKQSEPIAPQISPSSSPVNRSRRNSIDQRIQKIPIMRVKDQIKQRGIAIYRYVFPRFCDILLKSYMEITKKQDQILRIPKLKRQKLQFDSKFQSGNLTVVTQIASNEYDLFIRADTNTNGHRQWFYFKVHSFEPQTVRFNVLRFRKRYSLYQRGMKPYVKSKRNQDQWYPGGTNVVYVPIPKPKDCPENYQDQYMLSFTFQFQQGQQQVEFAAGIPFSYSFQKQKLNDYQLISKDHSRIALRQSILCKSMCGLNVPLITIQTVTPSSQTPKMIIVNARTHPGQTSASWVLNGFIYQILGNQQIQKTMEVNNIVFKIVPMLNVDGVLFGNYRTGILGQDFNRKFSSGKADYFPEINGLRKLVSSCKKNSKIQLFLDLHGHSILKNCFFYGPSLDQFANNPLKMLSHDLWRNSPYFKLNSCRYHANVRDKIETARIHFQLKEKLYALTCQNSLGLFYNQNQTFQMLKQDWMAFGSHLVTAIVERIKDTEQLPSIRSTTTAETSFSLRQTHLRLSKQSKLKKSQLIPLGSHQSPPKFQDLPPRIKKFHQNLTNEQKNKFKIRRKSQAIKTLKISRNIFPPKIIHSEQEDISEFTRSKTQDSKTFLDEIDKLSKSNNNGFDLTQNSQTMEVIPENFSDQYQSLNDSDAEQDDLDQQDKKALYEGISAQVRRKATQVDKSSSMSEHQDQSPKKDQQIDFRTSKINGFKQIRFRSIQEGPTIRSNLFASVHKHIKRDIRKAKDFPSRSLNSTNNDQQFQAIQIIKKKAISERGNQRITVKDSCQMFQIRQRK